MSGAIAIETDNHPRPSLQVIARAGSILRALKDRPDGMTLAELSATVELPKSSAHRLVRALSEEGLLTSGSRGRIGLGPLVIALAQSSERPLGEELHSIMRQLSAQLAETVDLSVPDGAAVRFVAQQPGTRRLRAVSAVGARFPMYCTSGGKALLALMPRSEAMDLVPARIPALTPNTITSRRALWQELDEIREARVAFDREEHTLGIAAVGVVVRDAFGSLAAVSVPVPSQRFYGDEDTLSSALLATCEPYLAELTQ